MQPTHDIPASTTTAPEVSHQVDPSAGPMMRAIVQHRYGSADVLESAKVERPSIASNEVLIEVHAAGVDRGVWHLMTGMPYLVRLAGYGITKPKNPIPGLDVAGRVVAVGADVARFAPGDKVFGIARGAYAEYAAAAEDKLAHKPANLTFEQGAVAAISGITALQALTTVANVQPGQRVLIIGASGGVGSYAVQLAKALGSHVTGVAGTRNVAMVRSIGADEVLDYNRDDFADGTTTYDVILDIGGRSSISRLRRALTPNGVLVIAGGEGGNRLTGGVGRQLRAMVLSLFTRQRLTTFISKEHFIFMEQLAEHLESGGIVPAIGQQFDLEDVPEAIRKMEAGRTSGKSVVVVRKPGAADAS